MRTHSHLNRGGFTTSHLRLMLWALLPLLTFLWGCSKEEIKKAYDSAATTTEDLAAKAKEKADAAAAAAAEKAKVELPETGSFALRSSIPIKKSATATLELISVGDGRPNVVQITSYDAETGELSYPAVLMHGTVDVGIENATGLSKQSVQFDLYVQSEAESPIFMTKPGAFVAVTFGNYDPEKKVIRGTVSRADMISSDDKPIQFLGGELIAVVKEQATEN